MNQNIKIETPQKQLWDKLGKSGLQQFTIHELKDELRFRRLTVSGNKKEIIERLHMYYSSLQTQNVQSDNHQMNFDEKDLEILLNLDPNDDTLDLLSEPFEDL